MVSSGLPLPGGAAPASDADAFAPNAFIRITTEGANCADHALRRDGPRAPTHPFRC